MLLYYNILNVHINTKYIFYLLLVALFVLVRQPTKYKGIQSQHLIKALTVRFMYSLATIICPSNIKYLYPTNAHVANRLRLNSGFVFSPRASFFSQCNQPWFGLSHSGMGPTN